MSLNERKIQILQAIINDYIETAEPVGSRTIAKKYNLGISSATIRNEMSDLEEMGFILQPHASSGRIPSDMGYRLYVDHLMQKKELGPEEQRYLQNVITRNVGQIDYLLEETAKALSGTDQLHHHHFRASESAHTHQTDSSAAPGQRFGAVGHCNGR